MGELKGRIPLIAGPTAVGKTEFAIGLAEKLGGEIISVDSRQIYKGFRIGTAQPTEEEREKIRHHLIDELPADHVISSGKYAEEVHRLIRQLRDTGKYPVLAGGSFMYIQAVTEGIIRNADSDPKIRDHILDFIEKEGSEAAMTLLREIDPEYAALVHPNDTKRLVRALEIYRLTGKSPSEVFSAQKTEDEGIRKSFCLIFLTRSRQSIYRRIEERVGKMMETGWLREVEALLADGVDPACHPMQGVGYRQLTAVLSGELSQADAVRIIVEKTRQFAKKQMTWMKKMKPDVVTDMDNMLISS